MKLRLPDSFVTIFFIIVFCGLASHVIPSGNYYRHMDKINQISYVIPGSYHVVKHAPVSIFNILKSIPMGMISASDIIFFVLIVGGCFGVIETTGAVKALIKYITVKFYKKERLILPIIMISFSIAGAVIGSAEEIIPLIPIFITLAVTMGYDAITGTSMVFLGALSGYIAGFLNPFSTGIAQRISGLPVFSGMLYRIICHVIILSIAILFMSLHVSKIKNQSIHEDDEEYLQSMSIEVLPQLSKRHVIIMLMFMMGLIFIVYGVAVKRFSIIDISTTFLVIGILSGIIGGFKANRIIVEFINGASNILYGALIIGLARGIIIVMNAGNITDTVIYYLSNIVNTSSPVLCSITMFISHMMASLLIPSSSGEASTTMPIMTAIADLSKVSRQTSVLAYQFGEGMNYLINPASGYLMAVLAVSGISWKRWIKFILPLFITWSVVCCALIIISVIIGYGPF